MRFAARACAAGILIVCCRGTSAAEAGSSWWPFGHHADAPAQASLPSTTAPPPSTTTTPTGAAPVAHEAQMPTSPPDANSDNHWMLNTPKKKVSWPSLHFPKALSSKSAPASNPEVNKNKWAEKTPAAPKPSPMQSVKNGAHSVASGTKSAWHKTVAAVTPGDKTADKSKQAAPGSHVARRDVSPPFWKKMLGAKEPELQQPQTVPQWMAQKRLDP
jgi:hypothetical protein